MHLLKYNPDAKTLTEVPPSEFDADPTCRYFYVLGNRAHVPIVTPDGIGEIVWQHPDYQPPATEAGARCAVEQLRSKPGSWQPQDKLGRLIEQDRSDPRQLMLVERVADAIGAADDEGLTNMTWSYHSRAAIRAVAEWLRSEYPQREGCGTAWANLLDNEANL